MGDSLGEVPRRALTPPACSFTLPSPDMGSSSADGEKTSSETSEILGNEPD